MPLRTRNPRLLSQLLVALLLLLPGLAAAQSDTDATGLPISPEAFLGRPVGTDFQLADWPQISGYFARLASESPRMEWTKVGKTTEGRDFPLAIISSPENLGRLDEIKTLSRRLATGAMTGAERREVLAKLPVVFFIASNLHSTEIASAEMTMQLAWELVTREDAATARARREVVVLLAPSINPDGMQQVVEWYRSIQGTPYEDANLPELYQRYAGHDNNRDWFLLSLEETRVVTRLLYTEWFPQVYWDVHQQGSRRERFFVPPYRDPLNPNIDPISVTSIGVLGGRVLYDMTRAGLTGISTGVSYDMWWTGGNRNVPMRHNVLGILSEAASANLASPIFLPRERLDAPRGIATGYGPSNRFPAPWPGGWWRIGDIIRYELAMGHSLLASLSKEREEWLSMSLEVAQRSVAAADGEAPVAWLVPPLQRDRGAGRRLFETLLAGGITVERATAPFVADGLEYPADTLILHRSQVYGRYLKDLFEVQRYPDGLPPYDVSGWTLPVLMGIRRVEVARPFEAESVPVTTADDAVAPWLVRGAAAVEHLPASDSDSWRGVIELLRDEVAVELRDPDFPHWRLAAEDRRAANALARAGVAWRPASPNPTTSGTRLAALDRLPRIALYSPWSGNKNEGWTRWVFDHFELPYQRVRNETLRAGSLRDHFDVIVLPSISAGQLRDGRGEGTVFPRFAGGLAPEGSIALEEFVREGGTLIACEHAVEYVRELFALPIRDVTRENENRGDDGFRCPGSVLRTVVAHASRWTSGLPASTPALFSGSRAYRMLTDDEIEKELPTANPLARPEVETLVAYPASEILVSGWIQKESALAGHGAWLRARYGRGQIHLFGVRPQYRAWSHATFHWLLRAMLLR